MHFRGDFKSHGHFQLFSSQEIFTAKQTIVQYEFLLLMFLEANVTD